MQHTTVSGSAQPPPQDHVERARSRTAGYLERELLAVENRLLLFVIRGFHGCTHHNRVRTRLSTGSKFTVSTRFGTLAGREEIDQHRGQHARTSCNVTWQSCVWVSGLSVCERRDGATAI